MAAKEMCALGVPRVPFRSFYSINLFTQREIKSSVPCYRYFIVPVEPIKKGYVCMQV